MQVRSGKNWRGKTVSCSLVSLYLGFKKELKEFGVEHYSNFLLGEDVKIVERCTSQPVG